MSSNQDQKAFAVAIAGRLKIALEQSGLGQAELGRKIGVSKAAVNQWLSTGQIQSGNLMMFAQITGCDIGWLMSGKGGVTPEQRAWIELLEQLPEAERRRIQDYAHVISITASDPDEEAACQ